MIQAHNLCLSFGSQKIFDHISFTIGAHDRVGLVGRNGSGKSTMLAAILNTKLLDEGSISIIKGKKIAYMPQDVVLQSDKSILEEAFSTFAYIGQIKQELADLEKILESSAGEADVDRYAQLHEQLGLCDENKAMARTKKMLMGLGFSEAQFDMPVASLSVGWKMRIVLSKLLLQDADFYLFDEPTNHLDLIAKEWFLGFLKAASFGFMLVCHERYFLDELCDTILELEFGKGTVYTGNYSSYLEQKEHATHLLESAYAQQQKEIKQKQETIERFRAKASKAAMAQSMIKSLDKIDRITLPPAPRNVSFTFPPIEQSGRIVVTVENVAHSFDAKKLFDHVSCIIERGNKVAIIAPNGGGKTTLFNLMVGSLPLQHGTITFGYNVKHAIFAQDQTATLDGNKSILDNIRERAPKKTEQTIRTVLGSFLFSNDDVLKKVKVLSGGEKNRVGMTGVLLQDANLLLLDEPTNHLDIPSKEILLKALQSYQGTIIFVSHDRDFVNQLATHILELTPHGAYMYAGNYDTYAYQKKTVTSLATTPAAAAVTAIEQKPVSKLSNKELFELRKKSNKLENKIEKLEAAIAVAQAAFAELEFGSLEYSTAESNLNKLKQELEQCTREWEEAQKNLNR